MDEFLNKSQLDELLKRDIASIIEQQKAVIDKLIDSLGESYILFGAGRLGQIALAGLRKAGIEPRAFTDNNHRLWNTTVNGLEVLSPRDAVSRYSQKAVFVVTVYTSQPVWDQLSVLGVKVISFAALAWHYPNTLLPHADLELPYKIFEQSDEIRKAYALWADDVSRREFLGQLRWHTYLDRSVLPAHLPQQDIYFPDDLVISSANEVFVDCGAFDGDSVREFIKRRKSSFGHIIAIEPDPSNSKSLQNYVSMLPDGIKEKITTLQNAVGSQRTFVTFNATGTAGSSIGEGSYRVECAPLDQLVSDKEPTFIKMDIEGAESSALMGAGSIISKHSPILAICLYHKQEHLWQIPLLIQSLSGQYRFFLRRYADECWEIVCYAIPVNRLVGN